MLLVNLAKGHIGEDSASVFGGLLVTTIGLVAFSRADTPPAERRPFFVYVDEFQSFTTLTLANMLSELRKSVDEVALIQDTISHYAPMLIAPLPILIRRAGVQKEFMPAAPPRLAGE